MAKIRFDTQKIISTMNRIEATLSNPRKSGFFQKLVSWFTDIIKNMFSNRGGLYGRPQWPGISPSIHGKTRRGSDGSNQGVYGPGSNPLVASGSYRNSFGVLRESNNTIIFGSSHPKSNVIPFGGWQTGRGPRFATPDVTSTQFGNELSHIKRDTIDNVIRQAIRG